MPIYFAVAIEMGPAAFVVTFISVAGFLIMFGLASVKGDYQGLVKTTLENDQINRRNRSERKP